MRNQWISSEINMWFNLVGGKDVLGFVTDEEI